MTFLRIIFFVFAITCLWLIIVGVGTLASGTDNTKQIFKTAALPAGFMTLCALFSAIAALKSSRVFAYLAIGMMAVIVGCAGYIPFGIGMHYHPDTNYVPWIVGLYSLIAVIGFGLIFLVRRYFPKGLS